MVTVDVEQAVREYLAEFGNTKEADLLAYIKREFDYSEAGSKKLVDRMESQKKIFRVVHSRLHPPGVYLTVKKYVPLEIQKELIRAHAQVDAAAAHAILGPH